MHTHTPLRIHLQRHPHCSFGVGVLEMEVPTGLVRPNRNRREVDLAEHSADGVEKGRRVAVARVSGAC
jgi:hypothetical protein